MSERLDIEGVLGHIYVDNINIIRYQTDSLFYYKNSDDKTMTTMTVTLVITLCHHFYIFNLLFFSFAIHSISCLYYTHVIHAIRPQVGASVHVHYFFIFFTVKTTKNT